MNEFMIPVGKIDLAKAVKEIGDFLVSHIKGSNLSGGVIGLSGGVDSAVALSIMERAFAGTGLRTLAYYLPMNYGVSDDRKNIYTLLKRIGFNMADFHDINISAIATNFERLSYTFKDPFHLGNAVAATRMTFLSGEAAKNRMLVVGTGNRDEYYLGYFTKRGDGAADVQPLLSLSKRMVYELADYLGIPREIASQEPTAGLWEGQTDEGELGFTYKDAETVINGFLAGFNADEIHRISGISEKTIDAVHARHLATEHKRKLPPSPKVSIKLYEKNDISRCDKALVIGRFQLLHAGHVDMFYQLKEHPSIKKLLVGVGTRGNSPDGSKYKRDFTEVKSSLEPLLKGLGLAYAIYDVPDINDSLLYAQHVKMIIPELDLRTAVVSGNPSTIKCFNAKYPIFEPEQRVVVHGSRIEELMRDGKPWKHLVL